MSFMVNPPNWILKKSRFQIILMQKSYKANIAIKQYCSFICYTGHNGLRQWFKKCSPQVIENKSDGSWENRLWSIIFYLFRYVCNCCIFFSCEKVHNFLLWTYKHKTGVTPGHNWTNEVMSRCCFILRGDNPKMLGEKIATII